MKTQKVISAIFSAVFAVLIVGIGGLTLLKPPDKLSYSERRELSQWQSPTIEAVRDGTWFDTLEKFMLDQFPCRDGFRRIKSVCQFYLFRQTQNNGIVIHDGQAAEISYPLTEKAENVYIKRINRLCEKYLSDPSLHIYTTVIPDKMLYMADSIGAPSIDYALLEKNISEQLTAAKYIDIFDRLSRDSYYSTDTHWRQECLIPVAERLLSAMHGGNCAGIKAGNRLAPFYGVYYGQSALPMSPDTIVTMTSDKLSAARVMRADKMSGELDKAKMYYEEKVTASGDAYDVFLGGACTVTVINAADPATDRTLYLFSDSFGRSLAPLLLGDYARVVVYDIRYIRAASALEKVAIEPGSDVLIAYSISSIKVSSNLQVD